MRYYILEGKNPVQVHDIEHWEKWMEDKSNWILKKNKVTDIVKVSTVFLGIDESLKGAGLPVCFSTAIIGGAEDGLETKHNTWEEAESEHKKRLTTY